MRLCVRVIVYVRMPFCVCSLSVWQFDCESVRACVCVCVCVSVCVCI